MRTYVRLFLYLCVVNSFQHHPGSFESHSPWPVTDEEIRKKHMYPARLLPFLAGLPLTSRFAKRWVLLRLHSGAGKFLSWYTPISPLEMYHSPLYRHGRDARTLGYCQEMESIGWNTRRVIREVSHQDLQAFIHISTSWISTTS